jgi:hypothetical protein
MELIEKIIIKILTLCQFVLKTVVELFTETFYGWYCFAVLLTGCIQIYTCWIIPYIRSTRYFFEWKDFFRDYPVKVLWRIFNFEDYRRDKQGELIRNVFEAKRKKRRSNFLRSLRHNGRGFYYYPFDYSGLTGGFRWTIPKNENIYYEPFLLHCYFFKERDDLLQEQRLIEAWYAQNEGAMSSKFFYQSYQKTTFHPDRTDKVISVYKWDKEFLNLRKVPFSRRLEELKKLRDERGKRYV